MNGAFAGNFSEDMEGDVLSRVVVDHWRAGAGAALFADEVVHACEVTGLSADSIADVIGAISDYRGHDSTADVLMRAYVPEANRRAVCDLLDQIISLCVDMGA